MEHIALYRKYRPKVFEEVLAQDQVTGTLINQIESNRVSHAYLFNGPRGTGKTTCAKIISRAVNCLNPQGHNPCNQCENCKQILQDSFLDVIEMDAASHNGVDDIREIIDGVRYPPSVGKMKVIIIDEAHMITKAAFNALLKTIEEPPSYVMFIFATTEPQKIPQTIISRCQRFDFKRIDGNDMHSYLAKIAEKENIHIDADALVKISNQAGGAMRDALGILEKTASAKYSNIGEEELDEILGTGFEDIEHLIEALLMGDIYQTLNLSSNIYYSGKDINNVREELIEYLRKGILYSAGLPNKISEVKKKEEAFFERIDAKTKHGFFIFALGQFIESNKNKNFSNTRAEFEYTLASICAKPDLKKKGAIESKLIELDEKIKKIDLERPRGNIVPNEKRENALDSDNYQKESVPGRVEKKSRDENSDEYFESMFDGLDEDFFDDYEDAFVSKNNHGKNVKKQGKSPGNQGRAPIVENAGQRISKEKDWKENQPKPKVVPQAEAVQSSKTERKTETVGGTKQFRIGSHSWEEILDSVKEKNPYAHTVICKLNPISFEGGELKASFPTKLKALSVGFESRGLSNILKDSVRELSGEEIKITII